MKRLKKRKCCWILVGNSPGAPRFALQGMEQMKARNEKLLQPEILSEFALDGREKDFEDALADDTGALNVGVVSLKGKKQAAPVTPETKKESKGSKSSTKGTNASKKKQRLTPNGIPSSSKSKRPKLA